VNEIIIQNDYFKPTATGLVISGEPSYEVWEEYGRKLQFVEGAIQWLIGDWLNYGEQKWGEMYAQAVDETQAHTWRNYKWVANAVNLSLRNDKLSWTHHLEVAKLPSGQQKKYLDLALLDNLTVRELHNRIMIDSKLVLPPMSGKTVTAGTVMQLYKGDMLDILPSLGKFDLVLTDPPYGVTDYYWDISHSREWLTAIKQHLADSYNLFWFCSPAYQADTEMILRELGLPIQSRIVWHRRNMAMGSAARNKFIDTWEMIFHVGNRELNFPTEWSEAWFDVQTFAVPQTNFNDTKYHPTQKPIELIRRLIEFGSYPGDRIIDPFAGSGTSGAACPSDRECTLIEREEEYISIIEQRLNVRRL